MNIDYRLALVGFLLVLLLLSVGFNYKFLKQNRYLTRELVRTSLRPLGLDYFDDPALLADDKDETRVVFLGDSRAASWPEPELDGSFSFINWGVDGHTSAQTAQRFAAHDIPVPPDVIVVQVCVNDLRVIPVFPAEKEAIIQACQENIQQIVAQSRALGATVLLTTIFPVQNPPLMERLGWSGSASDVYDGIEAVNEAIRSLAGDDVWVLDAYGLLVDENGRLQAQYTVDHLHINEAGYRVLNEALVEILKRHDSGENP